MKCPSCQTDNPDDSKFCKECATPFPEAGHIHPRNYYELGKLYEQKGIKRKAKANYRKFLKLWKDADPGLPEVEDAKMRLAGL